MKTLIEVVETWIDDRVMAKIESSEKDNPKWMKIAQLMHDVKQMEEIHIRDANRIAELERRVMSLDEVTSFDNNEANIIDIKERLEDLESSVEEAQGTADEAQYCANNVESSLEDIESRFESVEGEVDIEEVARNVRDGVEEFIIDAVRTEIDAIDFKVTVER